MSRVNEGFLIPWIVRTRSIKGAPIKSLLNFHRNVVAVGIATVKQQLTGSQPPWVKVGKITARPVVSRCILNLMRYQDPVHVKPHARHRQQRKDEKKGGSRAFSQSG